LEALNVYFFPNLFKYGPGGWEGRVDGLGRALSTLGKMLLVPVYFYYQKIETRTPIAGSNL
jgi:hypothetical protein